jgi:hypothetical protein
MRCGARLHDESVVTVLLELLECEGRRMLSGMQSTIAQPPSVSGVNRLFAQSPQMAAALVAIWLERELQRHAQPTRRDRPKEPSITGYLIEDNSTMRKPKACTREGVGTHHSTTREQRMIGHRLDSGSQVSRQEKVCASEDMAFQSTITQMETFLRTWKPVVGMQTPVALDRWECATGMCCATHERDVLITTGLTSTGWCWQT